MKYIVLQLILSLLTVVVFMLALLLVVTVSAPQGLSNNDAYGMQEQNQTYKSSTITSICGNIEPENYTFSQQFKNLQVRTRDNSTVSVSSQIVLEVYDTHNNMIAQSKDLDVEFETNEGLPFDRQIKVYITCANNTSSPGLEFPVVETISFKHDGLLLWVSPLSVFEGPTVNDPNLTVEIVYRGINFPTSMAFMGQDDILVLEKNTGKVRRIVDNHLIEKPLIDLNVAGNVENGLLGVTIAKEKSDDIGKEGVNVFLYFTETNSSEDYQGNEKEPLGNRVYKYELSQNQLVDPQLLVDLPGAAWAVHSGGKIMMGPDNNLYITVGDVAGFNVDKRTKAQNYDNGTEPDGRSGILRITQDGKPVGKGILGDSYPLNLYYAYGIRSSFGMDFDPVTGSLWDTENGPYYGDEINKVQAGFNSGWAKVQGLWKPSGPDGYYPGQVMQDNSALVDFGDRGNYSAPELAWLETVGPTDLTFLNSHKLGKKYENDMFVGDVKYGNLYHFDLDPNRNGLSLSNTSLADKIADNLNESEEAVFAQGFGGITDLQVGPDGYLYIASLHSYVNEELNGTIYRIVPKH